MPKRKTQVTLKNLSSVINAMKKVLVDTKQSKSLLRDIGVYSEKRIRSKTTSGKNMVLDENEGGKLEKNPPLSTGYKSYRRKLKSGGVKNGKVVPSDNMRPGVSQLTLTGKMLDSLRNVVLWRRGRVIIRTSGFRKVLRRGDPRTNQDLATRLAKKGRRFLGMDRTGYKVIRKKVLRVLRKNIRDFNK